MFEIVWKIMLESCAARLVHDTLGLKSLKIIVLGLCTYAVFPTRQIQNVQFYVTSWVFQTESRRGP